MSTSRSQSLSTYSTLHHTTNKNNKKWKIKTKESALLASITATVHVYAIRKNATTKNATTRKTQWQKFKRVYHN